MIQTPYYIVYEDRLRKNLSLIKEVSEKGDVDIIMAFKANALWKTFPIIREYINSSTASSINEMRLSHDYLGGDVHAYCPGCILFAYVYLNAHTFFILKIKEQESPLNYFPIPTMYDTLSLYLFCILLIVIAA